MIKNYIDITSKWLKNATPNSHAIEEQLYYEYNGTICIVDDKNIVLDYSDYELQVAIWLKNTLGGRIKMIPRINNPEGIQTPDYIFNNLKFDLKRINGNSKRTIDTALKNKKNQTNNFILDISYTKLSIYEVMDCVKKFNSPRRNWINIIIVKKDNNLVCILKRNKKEINQQSLKNGPRLISLR